jgi:hypothetical protein
MYKQGIPHMGFQLSRIQFNSQPVFAFSVVMWLWKKVYDLDIRSQFQTVEMFIYVFIFMFVFSAVP